MASTYILCCTILITGHVLILPLSWFNSLRRNQARACRTFGRACSRKARQKSGTRARSALGLASHSPLGNGATINNSDTKRKGKFTCRMPRLQVAGHSGPALLKKVRHDHQLGKTLSAFTVALARHPRAGNQSRCPGTALK